ncbi:universal stress protein family, putative [Gloeomargarita lithophora Alchichica-D10]|uniref:Universal stress protein family, putative n=2 Tax=Gloeomargarita TaxID=1188227 RepID=A0A1J0AFC4_9CYAN|nr:universal stress protein family, putative [Gloeomargarita lithophora Alchichica-D10]
MLVAVDGSGAAQGVLQSLRWLQVSHDGQVQLVYVHPPIVADSPLDAPHPEPDLAPCLAFCQQILPCACSIKILTGDPAEEIVAWAGVIGAQLILIGSRGLTGVERILRRSVSAQVVADAPCAVLVVHG